MASFSVSLAQSATTLYGYYAALHALPWYSQILITSIISIISTIALPLVAFALYYPYWIYLRPRYFSPFRHLPGPPVSEGHWFWGEAVQLINKEYGTYQTEWNRRFGGQPGQPGFIKTVGPIGMERLIVFSPTALRQIMNDYQYTKPPFASRILSQITGHGLLTVEYDVHKKMRGDLNPAFATKYLAAQYEECALALAAMCDEFNRLIGEKDAEVVNAYDVVTRALLDIICVTAFGYEVDSLHNPDEPLSKAYHTLIGLQGGGNLAALIVILSLPFGVGTAFIEALLRNNEYWLPILQKIAGTSWLFYPVSVLAEYVDSVGTIQRIAERLLEQKTAEAKALKRLQRRDASQQGKIDILSLIIKGALDAETEAEKTGNGKTARKMDARECKAHIMTFLGAGHETTSSGVSWAIWLLANNLDVQRKLRAECLDFLAQSHSGHPSYYELRELKYLNAVVVESLRIRPSVPGTFRKSTKGSYLDGVWCPKGTVSGVGRYAFHLEKLQADFDVPHMTFDPCQYLAISSFAINTDPRVWGPDAADFVPERWLPEETDGHCSSTSDASTKDSGGATKTESGSLRPRGVSSEWDPVYSYMSFIAGNHHCIGKNMAQIEMKAVLFQMVTRFAWTKVSEDQTIRGDTAITMKPRGGVPVRLRRLTEEDIATA